LNLISVENGLKSKKYILYLKKCLIVHYRLVGNYDVSRECLHVVSVRAPVDGERAVSALCAGKSRQVMGQLTTSLREPWGPRAVTTSGHIHKSPGKTGRKGTFWHWITTKPENVTIFNYYGRLKIQFCISLHKLEINTNRNKGNFIFLSFSPQALYGYGPCSLTYIYISTLVWNSALKPKVSLNGHDIKHTCTVLLFLGHLSTQSTGWAIVTSLCPLSIVHQYFHLIISFWNWSNDFDQFHKYDPYLRLSPTWV